MPVPFRAFFVSLFLPLAALPGPALAQDELCAQRTPCKIESAKPAGRDAQGRALTVVELNLGTKNPDNDHEAAQCRPFRREFWLRIAGEARPQKLFDFCNDGYGASGVGEDEVTVEPNRITHQRVGGSAWRWDYTNVYSLSPWRHLTHRSCSYHTLSPGFATQSWDWTRFAGAGSWKQQPKGEARESDEMGCHAQGPLRYVAIPLVPDVAGLAANAALPLGRCAAVIGEDGRNGFVAYGRPKPNGAELRVLGIGGIEAKRLDVIVSVRDRHFAGGSANWIHNNHIELWLGRAPALAFGSGENSPTRQFGIGFDGAVHKAPNDTGPGPTVIARHETSADGWRTITLRIRLPVREDDLGSTGLSVVYSNAEGGRQARLTATAQVNFRNHRGVGGFYRIDRKRGSCAVVQGAIEIKEAGIPSEDSE